jgi:hypothetical protein
MREEVMRPRVEDYDADGGVEDMLDNYHEAHFAEGYREESQRQPQRRITTCCLWRRNPFMTGQRFLNWMALVV